MKSLMAGLLQPQKLTSLQVDWRADMAAAAWRAGAGKSQQQRPVDFDAAVPGGGSR